MDLSPLVDDKVVYMRVCDKHEGISQVLTMKWIHFTMYTHTETDNHWVLLCTHSHSDQDIIKNYTSAYMQPVWI